MRLQVIIFACATFLLFVCSVLLRENLHFSHFSRLTDHVFWFWAFMLLMLSRRALKIDYRWFRAMMITLLAMQSINIFDSIHTTLDIYQTPGGLLEIRKTTDLGAEAYHALQAVILFVGCICVIYCICTGRRNKKQPEAVKEMPTSYTANEL